MSLTDFLAPGRATGQTPKRGVALLLVLMSLALFLPGFVSLQPMDRDEPRFAQATKQMLETGDFVAIRFQTEARNKKPVGVYWLQAGFVAGAQALGVPDARAKIWVYRLPSLIGAVATVLLTWWAALALVGEGAALIAAMLMASTILLGVEARLAKTDAIVAATIAAAMGVLARHWMARGREALSNAEQWRLAGIFWAALGVGFLVKGPITPMVPAFACVALAIHARAAGWLRGLKPLSGLILCLLVVTPWFVLIMIATKGAFLADSLGADMMSKVAGGQEAHGAPPGSYLGAFFLTGWPMAPLTLLAAPFVWRARREPAVAFLLAWLVPAWLLFEAVPTKLPHYVLPLFPALAILTAVAIEKQALALGSRLRWGLWLIPGVAVVLLLIGLMGPVVLGARSGWLFYLAAPVVLWQAWRMGQAIRARAAGSLVPGGALLAFLCYMMVYGGIMTGPVFEPFAMSSRLADARGRAQALTTCPDLAPASTRYREPSLVFLTRTDILFESGEGVGRFMGQGSCRIAFVSAADEPAFLAALGAGADGVRLTERLTGINLNGGRKLDIGVYLRQGDGR